MKHHPQLSEHFHSMCTEIVKMVFFVLSILEKIEIM